MARGVHLRDHQLAFVLEGEARLLESGAGARGPAGVATNDIRISLFGVPLYVLIEQYALDGDGELVFVRSYERFGPFPFLFNREKKHPARVVGDGTTARYYDMPILGGVWTGDYQVANPRHVESILTCEWARATESIDRVP